jgi:hypothetical protein
LIGLNSNLVGARAREQRKWLERRLRNSDDRCVLAFWHHFVFSSGEHGHANSEDPDAPIIVDTRMRPHWLRLYNHGASVVLAAHDHDYEQFRRQDADGERDARGLRSFVVGTGGGRLRRAVDYNTQAPNSEVYSQDSHGLLKIQVFPTRYEWNFLPIEGDADIPLPVAGARCNQRRIP